MFFFWKKAGTTAAQRIGDTTSANDNTGPLPVQFSDGAGGILSPNGSGDLVNVTLSLDTSAYAVGDVLADTQPVLLCTRAIDVDALLRHLILIDEDDQGGAIDFHFFSANRSLGTENGPPSISDANADDWLGVVSVAAVDYKDLGGVKVAKVDGGLLRLQPAAGTRTVYMGAISQDTKTYSASGIKVRLGQDWE